VGFPRDQADALFQSWKRLSPPKNWEFKSNSNGRETGREIECLIEIEGAVWRGAALLLVVSAGNLDKCSMSLLARHGDCRTRHPIYRLDINPTMPHRNMFVGREDLRGMRFWPGETHEHVYSDNLDAAGALMDRCDMIARPIEKPPTTFLEGLDYIRDRIHLLNTDEIPPPETQGDLL
jgi:hypothetical protein